MQRHTEKRHLPYTAEQLYALVLDVERYPEFLPWAVAAKIRRRESDVFWADLVIGYQMFRERFSSRVQLTEPGRRIDVAYSDGPFHHLSNHWCFEPTEQGCEVDFFVEFQFRNAMFERIIGVMFNDAVRRMVAAFEGRARTLYGPAALTRSGVPRMPAPP
jgi:coenzyme Q-binding protein COQ10